MKKSSSSNRSVRRKKKSSGFGKWFGYGLIVFFILLILGLGYHYRNGLAYYLSFKTDKVLKEEKEAKRISDIRNFQLMTKYSNKLIGIDVSEYQGKIEWDSVRNIEETFPITFVLIRATAGDDRPDNCFKDNWKAVRNKSMIRGAYHYYRPDENSIDQADLFIKTVRLRKGDLPPVLDIEKLPANQSLDSLKVGLKRWLDKIEKYYGVKPIIYSGEKYYTDFLRKEFSDYPFWIANYNLFAEKIKPDWMFWQFTEKAAVNGINGNVDVNIYNGDIQKIKYLTIGN